MDMSTDAEDTESEESIETDKLYDKKICLLSIDTHSISFLSEHDKAPMYNNYRCDYISDHFDTIPSPPPDNAVI